MEKHIINEKTGISYTMRGDYYLLDLYLSANGEPIYGKYGFLRLEYLREYKNVQYINLLTQGKLTEHLNAVDKEVKEKVDYLVEIMKKQEGVTEELKAQEQLKWVGMMNNIKNAAEEIVLKDLVYV